MIGAMLSRARSVCLTLELREEERGREWSVKRK